jgi:hypothetical protein
MYLIESQKNVIFYLVANKKKLVLILAALLLVLGNLFFGIEYFLQAKKIQSLEKEIEARQTNDRVVNFLNIFIENVLKTDKEVSFEDRLKLENAIRDIDDPEILARWEKFTSASYENDIQNGVKDLLQVPVKKITY